MTNYKTGVRFNIDPVSKKISTPHKEFRLVRDDTNSVVLSFRMPRFISGVDMSECENVKIFYKNIDLDTDEYHEDALPITDLIVGEGKDDDYVFFTYTIKPGATTYAGVFLIAITFRFGDDYIWSTEPYDGIPVVDRLDTSESIKKNVPPDLLEAWKEEILRNISTDIRSEVQSALSEAKESGEFKGEDGKDGYTPIKGIDYFTDEDKTEIVNRVIEDMPNIDTGDITLLIETTYDELKALRDNSGLSIGCFYRITDYVATTIQEGTQSAEHPFDILIRAISENELESKVSAILHRGDEYFANNDLSAWELWYSLDNDTSRFAWADEVNGKGVIFRMIDEFGNECPYDFKSIQMRNALNTEDQTYYYTFDTNGADLSLDGSQCYDNVIKEYVDGTQRINRIIFITHHHKNVQGNFFDILCYNNTLDGSCRTLKFERECFGNQFGFGCTTSNFGTKFKNNIVGSEVQSINVGKGAQNNIFASNIYYCTFGTYFRNNIVAKYTYYSDFGHYVQNMIMGKNADNIQQYFRHLIVEGNNTYFNLIKDDSIPATTYVENITIGQGTSGTSSSRLMINLDTKGNKYKLTYAKDSLGELKAYCDADENQGVDFTTDETLTLDPITKVLSVNTATEANRDNTLPITSAAVATQIGNIEILLSRI